MPEYESKTVENIVTARHEKYYEWQREALFFRTAYSVGLDGGIPEMPDLKMFFNESVNRNQALIKGTVSPENRMKARGQRGNPDRRSPEYNAHLLSKKRSHFIYPRPWESMMSYVRRLNMAMDDNKTARAMNRMTGHFMDANHSFDLKGFSKEIRDKFNDDIDNDGRGRMLLTEKMFVDAALLGKVFVLSDNGSSDLEGNAPIDPRISVVPMECVTDYRVHRGRFQKFFFEKFIPEEVNFKTVYIHKIFGFTEDKMFVVAYNSEEDKWSFEVPPIPNPIGVVPVSLISTSTSKSVVETPAKSDFIKMNIRSWATDHVGRMQTSILTVPASSRKDIPRSPDGSYVIRDGLIIFAKDGESQASMTSTTGQSIEAHMTLMGDADKVGNNAAGNRDMNQTKMESSESKAMDWKETEKVLKSISLAITEAWKDHVEYISLWLGSQGSLNYEIDGFDFASVIQSLEEADLAIAVDMGKRGNANIRKSTYRKMRPLEKQEEVALVDADIDAIEDVPAPPPSVSIGIPGDEE